MTNGRDKTLITQLATILDNDWKENDKVTTFLAICYNNKTISKAETKINPLNILATAIHKARAEDASGFTLLTQLNVKKPETYKQATYRPHRQQ